MNGFVGMGAFQLDVQSISGFKSDILTYVNEEVNTKLLSVITTYADLDAHRLGSGTGLDFSNDSGNCASLDGIAYKRFYFLAK